MKLFCLVNDQGTAAAETVLCQNHFCEPYKSQVRTSETLRDVIPDSWTECTDNEACTCTVCGVIGPPTGHIDVYRYEQADEPTPLVTKFFGRIYHGDNFLSRIGTKDAQNIVDALNNKPTGKIRDFIGMIARMKTEEEFETEADELGNDNCPASEDWISTLNDLIEQARSLIDDGKREDWR
jgi:hypothetical protein